MPPNPNVNNTHTHKKKEKRRCRSSRHTISNYFKNAVLCTCLRVLLCAIGEARRWWPWSNVRMPANISSFFFFLPFPCPTSTPLFSLPLFLSLNTSSYTQLHTRARFARYFEKKKNGP